MFYNQIILIIIKIYVYLYLLKYLILSIIKIGIYLLKIFSKISIPYIPLLYSLYVVPFNFQKNFQFLVYYPSEKSSKS